ncbi:hypothetical protein GE107_03020 [Cohnella sp. CFH 77786]|nr:hypothetical protein [Cohnella sp. CFH 77786]MBW5445037.1 hypothetical protein [Cohnella sp. CFH 77786]
MAPNILLAEKTDMGNGDLFEMLTYLLVVLVSAVVMIVWLKRRGRRKRK